MCSLWYGDRDGGQKGRNATWSHVVLREREIALAISLGSESMRSYMAPQTALGAICSCLVIGRS